MALLIHSSRLKGAPRGLLASLLLIAVACSSSSTPGTNPAAGGSAGGSNGGSDDPEPSAGSGGSAGSMMVVPASGSGGQPSAMAGGGAGGGGAGGVAAGGGGKAGSAGAGGAGGMPNPHAGTVVCAKPAAPAAGDGGAAGEGAGGQGVGGAGVGEGGEDAGPTTQTFAGFTLFNWVTNQKHTGCGPFYDDFSITVTGTPPITVVASFAPVTIQTLGSVLWDYDDTSQINMEVREPYSLFGDEAEGDYDGPQTKGNATPLYMGDQHSLGVRVYAEAAGAGAQLGSADVTITVVHQ